MPRITKLELTQANARLAADNAALRKQVGDLQLQLTMQAAARRPLPEYMECARQMAMTSGRAVKVGG